MTCKQLLDRLAVIINQTLVCMVNYVTSKQGLDGFTNHLRK